MTTLKYKVGDKLKVKDEFKDRCGACFQHTGWIEITEILKCNSYWYNAYNSDGKFIEDCGCYIDEHIEGYYNPVGTKKSHTFKVGDRVRIRQWDDIKHVPHFIASMMHLCGREATIVYIQEKYLHLRDWSDTSVDTNFEYTTDMIEAVEVIFDTSEDCSDSFAYAIYTINSIKKSKWTPEPAKYHNGDNWFTKSTVCIDGKEMTVEEFKAKTTLYRSALSAYNNYFPVK